MNPTFFTKLHFKFFWVFGSKSKLGLDNALTFYLSPTPPPLIFHTKNLLLFYFISFFSQFYDSLLFHKPGIFYKTSFRFFLEFLGAFQNLGCKIGSFENAPSQDRVGTRWRSNVDMVRWLRCHMAYLNKVHIQKQVGRDFHAVLGSRMGPSMSHQVGAQKGLMVENREIGMVKILSRKNKTISNMIWTCQNWEFRILTFLSLNGRKGIHGRFI
jgi:hypothetical protein